MANAFLATDVKIHLRDKIYLTTGKFHGSKVVHIRKFEEAANGRDYPTEKGVCITPGRFKTLVYNIGSIDRMYDYVHQRPSCYKTLHLGGTLYVSVASSFDFINIRHFYLVRIRY